jgi:hypothetical protein
MRASSERLNSMKYSSTISEFICRTFTPIFITIFYIHWGYETNDVSNKVSFNLGIKVSIQGITIIHTRTDIQ